MLAIVPDVELDCYSIIEVIFPQAGHYNDLVNGLGPYIPTVWVWQN